MTFPTGTLMMIGCGNMAGAMLRRWLEAGLPPTQVTVVDPAGPSLPEGARLLSAVPTDETAPDRLVLGFKPQQIAHIAPGLAPVATGAIYSMLAGVELATLRTYFPDARAIVRLMPNMPVMLGKGAIGLASDSPEERDAATALMAPLGLVEWLDAEDDFHALTALSGSGPAFVYRFIDALAAAGRDLGLSADQSLRLARATVEGAGALAAISDEDPGLLADRVASPGGTTREGLNVLDAESAILTLTAKALAAAERRSREMAEEAKRI